MSLGRGAKFFRSFAFYLVMGYLLVYLIGTLVIFFVSRDGIARTARSSDREDVDAKCSELLALLNQNDTGNTLAEAVTMEHYPPSTIFIVRIINPKGYVEYTVMWPKKIDIREWRTDRWRDANALPQAGVSEYYLHNYDRYLQVVTKIADDGRILQVGKGSFLEKDQKAMLNDLLLKFLVISTAFSLLSGFVMMVLTLRPISKMNAEMSEIIRTGAFERGAPPVRSMIVELDALGNLFNVITEKYANLIRTMRETMDHVAHDFRTPLTRIRGGAEIALGQFDKLPEDVAEALADIIEDCDRAKLQLQNLMDAREMESGFVKLDLTDVDLCEQLSVLHEMYLMVAEEKGVEFALKLPEERVVLKADHARLGRAIGNLVDNAIKYTPAGGHVELALARRGDEAVVSVSDTGIGIPADEVQMIWQRLYRGRKAQEAEKGLGLGLNIVQIIVKAHGGVVTVESGSGAGTKFSIRLKCEEQGCKQTVGA